ncbi:MAG: type II toxin-antitoxin system HicA family toxin [Flavisolibacter sp.]|nr:type II toxin-antitoxin system HicA family toxin [Flavisolibacter sp.]
MSVKRIEFIQHLASHDCTLFRHGSKHDIYQNNPTKKKTSVPRHPKLERIICNEICKQLQIPKF